MADVRCRCTAEICDHPNGEPCGKPVKDVVTVASVSDGRVGEEYLTGLCEECWARTNPQASHHYP